MPATPPTVIARSDSDAAIPMPGRTAARPPAAGAPSAVGCGLRDCRASLAMTEKNARNVNNCHCEERQRRGNPVAWANGRPPPNCHCEAAGRGNPDAWANGRPSSGRRSALGRRLWSTRLPRFARNDREKCPQRQQLSLRRAIATRQSRCLGERPPAPQLSLRGRRPWQSRRLGERPPGRRGAERRWRRSTRLPRFARNDRGKRSQ